ALRELLLQRLQRQRQALLGQLRAAGQGGVDVVQAKHVAPYQAGGRGGAEAAELPGPVVWLQRVQHRWRQRRRIVRGQVLQQRRLAAQGFDREIAGDRNAGDPPAEPPVLQPPLV